MLHAFLRPGYVRPFWLLVVVLAAIGVGRMALTPWVDARVREALRHQTDFDARYADLSLFSFPPSAVFSALEVEGVGGRPAVAMRRLELHTTWRELLRTLLADGKANPPPRVQVRLVDPTLHVHSGSPAQALERVAAWMRTAPPVLLDVVGIEGGQVAVGDDGGAQICADDVKVTVDELAVPAWEAAPGAAAAGRRLRALVDSERCRRGAAGLPGQPTALNEPPVVEPGH